MFIEGEEIKEDKNHTLKMYALDELETEEEILDALDELETEEEILEALEHVNDLCTKFRHIFFDSGCGDLIAKKTALDKLSGIGKAKYLVAGPLVITGVGEKKSVCEDGIFSICLSLHNVNNVILSGLCLYRVPYLYTEYIGKDILEARKTKKCCLAECLPKLPKEVGGDRDVLVGIKYAKYFPKLIFQCETGFGIFESRWFTGCCGWSAQRRVQGRTGMQRDAIWERCIFLL